MLWLTSKLSAFMVPDWLKRFLLVVLVAVGLFLLCWALIAVHDANTIQDYETKVIVEDARTTAVADNAASVQRLDDFKTATVEEAETRKVIENAKPAAISDARRAYLRCVRLQQQARAQANPARAPARC